MDITNALGKNNQNNNNEQDRTLDHPINDINKFAFGKRANNTSKDNKLVMQTNNDKEILGKIKKINKSEVIIRHYIQAEGESTLISCKSCNIGKQTDKREKYCDQ